MSTDPARVLVLGHEDARMFALCGYLTFRGFQVDRASDVGEAVALIRGLRYRSVIARLHECADGHAYVGLLRDLKQTTLIHTVLLLDTPTGPVREIDHVFGADISIALIARSICQTLST